MISEEQNRKEEINNVSLLLEISSHFKTSKDLRDFMTAPNIRVKDRQKLLRNLRVRSFSLLSRNKSVGLANLIQGGGRVPSLMGVKGGLLQRALVSS